LTVTRLRVDHASLSKSTASCTSRFLPAKSFCFLIGCMTIVEGIDAHTVSSNHFAHPTRSSHLIWLVGSPVQLTPFIPYSIPECGTGQSDDDDRHDIS